MVFSNDKVTVLDSEGRSPWVGRAGSFAEYQSLKFPAFEDPFKTEPEADIYVAGCNGIDGEPTEYRIGKELWLPGRGFLYREALSCKRTKLNARMRAVMQFIQEEIGSCVTDAVYCTEMVTPLFEFLRGKYALVQGSEFLPGIPYGSFHNEVRCEDLQALTFDDESFDLVISCDVLEHVPEYKIAIHELARVLRPGGHLVMTTPVFPEMEENHVRALINDHGTIEHLYPAEYHGNPVGPPFALLHHVRLFARWGTLQVRVQTKLRAILFQYGTGILGRPTNSSDWREVRDVPLNARNLRALGSCLRTIIEGGPVANPL